MRSTLALPEETRRQSYLALVLLESLSAGALLWNAIPIYVRLREGRTDQRAPTQSLVIASIAVVALQAFY